MMQSTLRKIFAIFCATALVVPCFGQALDVDEIIAKMEKELKNGNRASALALANQAVQLAPKDPVAYFARGRAFEENRDFAKAISDYTEALKLSPSPGPIYQQRGGAYFKAGKVNEAIADFDKFLEGRISQKPFHWQRGIACYEAGKFDEGARQFALHQQVDRNDAENILWHFMCVARIKGFAEAQKNIFPPPNDSRVPMKQLYDLFAGKGKVEDVFKAAEAGSPSAAESTQGAFYANFYVGLFYEAKGDLNAALEYLECAVKKSEPMGYLGDVARIHTEFLKKRKAEKR